MHHDTVLTTYFTTRPDPQARAKRKTNLLKHIKTHFRARAGGARREIPGLAKPDEFDRIAVWYESLHAVGCHGVILHDCLSDAFVEQWTSPQVSFQYWEMKSPRSTNDERYYAYYQYLLDNPVVQRVFLLDLFDVEFYRDPFLLLEDPRYDFLSGGDEGLYNDELVQRKMLKAYGKAHYSDRIKLHAGTCGAVRDTMLAFLKAMLDDFDALSDAGKLDNLNMAVHNKNAYDMFDAERILYGYPLNSRFKAYEGTGDFAIRHK